MNSIKQKQEEGNLLMQNLRKKKEFFENNIKTLNELINKKEADKKQVILILEFLIKTIYQ